MPGQTSRRYSPEPATHQNRHLTVEQCRILTSVHMGLIGPVRPLIDALRSTGYHLGDALTARALADLGE